MRSDSTDKQFGEGGREAGGKEGGGSRGERMDGWIDGRVGGLRRLFDSSLKPPLQQQNCYFQVVIRKGVGGRKGRVDTKKNKNE